MPRQRQSEPFSADHAALGAAVVQLRRKADLTQEALAENSGLHLTHVGGIERGVRNPSYSTLVKLAAGLGVSLGTVASLADELRGKG
jgi:transcriptional regulator with XRE-family HTH domain